MSACPMCVARGKTWDGGDPRCAFPGGGPFLGENWMCATMNALRDIAAEGHSYVEDEHAAVLAFEDDDGCGFLYLRWYKHRGRTDVAMVDHTNSEAHTIMQPLTLAIAEGIARRVRK